MCLTAKLVYQICLTTRLYFPRIKRSAAMRLFALLPGNNFSSNSWWQAERSKPSQKYTMRAATLIPKRVKPRMITRNQNLISARRIFESLSVYLCLPSFLFNSSCFSRCVLLSGDLQIESEEVTPFAREDDKVIKG